MTLRTSSLVTTRWTPGTAFAACVSIDLVRPCATVLRKILACSMPGSRMVWVYSARPVTLSRASSRGSERLAHRARDIDAREFAFVGGRAAHVRDALGFVGGGVAGARESSVIDGRARQRSFRTLEPRSLLGGSADDDARGLDGRAFGL